MVLHLDVDKDGGVGKLVAGTGEVHMPVARDDAPHWERVGANEVVSVQVLVHDLEPEQRHLGEADYHLEGLLPLGVEPY